MCTFLRKYSRAEIGVAGGDQVARHAAVEDGLAGLISALGGKWTTSRHMASRVVDLAAWSDAERGGGVLRYFIVPRLLRAYGGPGGAAL